MMPTEIDLTSSGFAGVNAKSTEVYAPDGKSLGIENFLLCCDAFISAALFPFVVHGIPQLI